MVASHQMFLVNFFVRFSKSIKCQIVIETLSVHREKANAPGLVEEIGRVVERRREVQARREGKW